MAAAREYVRTLTVRSREEGAVAVAQRLHAVADAQKAVSSATQMTATAVDISARKMADNTRAFEALTSRLEGNARAFQTFVRDSRTAQSALDSGRASVTQYTNVVHQLREELQAAGTTRLGFNVDQSGLNKLLGIKASLGTAARDAAGVFEAELSRLDDIARAQAQQAATAFTRELDSRLVAGAGKSARDAASVFEAELSRIDDIARAKAQQAGGNFQQSLNARFGIGQSGSSARSSASVFEEDARSMEAMQGQAVRLRAELDPLGAAYERLQAQIAEYQQLAARQLITTDELAMGTTRAREAFDKSAAALVPMNDNVRLTSNQVTNLGYQLNDVATMAAMGASPFAILSSQAGQVVQALGDGPQGVRGSLKAIGTAIVGAAAAVGPFGWGLAAATAAAGGLFFAFRSKAPDMTKAMETHRTAVDAVAASYDGVASAISRASTQSVAVFNERQSRAVLELASRASLGSALRPNGGIIERSAFEEYASMGTVLAGVANEFKAFEEPILALQTAFENGQNKALEFQHEIAKLANLDPTNKALSEAASTLVKLTADAAAAQAQLQGLGSAFDKARERAAKFNELAGEQGGFIPNRMTDEQKIEQTYQQMMRLATTEAEVTRAQDLRRLSLEALAEAEAQRRGLYELDYKAITARTAAERANIEYQRVRLELTNQGIAAEQAELQAREAGTLSYQQSVTEFAEANRSRLEALNDNVAAAKAEVDALGMSEGAAASYNAEIQALTEYRRAAAAAGLPVDPVEEQAIRDAARALGEYTDQLKAATEAKEQLERTNEAFADLAFERSIIGLSDQEQDVREFVRQVGVEYDSVTGQKLAAEKRFNVGLQETQDQLEDLRETGRDAFLDIVDALMSGENAVDGLIGAFANLGKQLASLGAQKLFDNIFGTGQGQAQSGGGGIAGAIGGLAGAIQQRPAAPSFTAPAYSSGSTMGQTYAAPLVAVERSALPELTRATSGLTAAAKAIRTIESGSAGGNYSAMGPVTRTGDRAYGAYQVMGNNIPQWSKAALGRVVGNMEFLSSPKLQDAVFEHRFGGYMEKYGAEGASRAWFAGEGGMRNYKAQDVVGTSVGGYGSRFGQLYAQHGGASANDNSRAPAFNTREMARAVSDGNLDATRRIATGAVSGVGVGDAWSGMRTATGGFSPQMSPQAAAAMQAGWDGFGPMPGPSRLQSGLGVLGAGVGAFAGGYESGSPLSGGLSGALGGYQAGGAISSFLGVGAGMGAGLGIVGGAALGIIGGILGKRKEREAAHQQAAKAWADVQPQWQAYQESLSGAGPRSGLRAYQEQMMAEQMRFQEIGGAAWKRGTGNSSEHFNEVGLKLFNEHLPRGRQRFASSFEPARQDMLAGRGLEGPFIQAQEAIIAAGEKLLTFVDDAKFVFGDTSEQAGQAAEAARAQALATLDLIKPMSQIQTEVATFEGAASSLRGVLVDLGMSAEEASSAIDGKLAAAMERLGSDLTQSLTDSINEMDGKGYLATVRTLIEDTDQQMRDIAKYGLNVDTSLVDTFFSKSAQSIVDGAQLAGEAFDALIVAFPQLAGVVTAFTGAVDSATDLQLEAAERLERAVAERDQAETNLRQAYERTRSEIEAVIDRQKRYQETIRDFLTDMRLGDASPLSGYDQFAESQKAFRDLQALAATGDEDAQARLLGVSQSYLDEARSYYASSEAYYAAFREVESVLKEADLKAGVQIGVSQRELDALNRQVGSLIDIDTGVQSVADAIKDLHVTTKALLDAQKSLDTVRDWGTNPTRNMAIVEGLRGAGVDYTGGFGAGQFDTWFRSQSAVDQARFKPIVDGTASVGAPVAARDFGIAPVRNKAIDDALRAAGIPYSGSYGAGQFGAWVTSLSSAKEAQANAIAARFTHIGYMNGGFTGHGAMTDVAGLVHRGEVVWSQRDVARWGGAGAVDAMRTRLPQMAMPSMPQTFAGGNDNRALLAEVQKLSAEVRQLREENNSVTMAGAERVARPVEDMTRATESGNRETRRARRA